MRNYFNKRFLEEKKNNNQPIVKALLKYNYQNFSLIIIEYSSIIDVFDRETFWITQLKPYYNVLQFGGSSKGYKHSSKVKLMLSKLAKNRKLSNDTKSLISKALKGELNPFYGIKHSAESIKKIIASKSANEIFIYDLFKNLLVIFPSLTTLAKLIKSNNATLNKVIKSELLFRGSWYIKTNKILLEDTPKYSSYLNCSKLIEDIKKNILIKQPIFVFDKDKNFIRKFDGIKLAELELGIRHEVIKKHVISHLPYNNYIFSYHRLLN